MKICAILPMKHNSSRVPGKNYRNFNGKPLFMYILDTVLECKLLDKVVIDTNSELIINLIGEEYNSEKIIIYNRPKHLWDGSIAMNVILENVINDLNLNYDYFFQTHTTNPLLKVETINEAIKTFLEKELDGYDSLFSVKQWNTRLYQNINNKVVALNHNPNELLPTQDLEPLYEENSCMYLFNKRNLIKKKHRIGYKPYMFIMNDIESSDIDIETDFLIAECLHKTFRMNSNKVVLVTGGAGGIGLDICKKFKKCGWTVVGTSRRDKCDSNFMDHYIQGDLTNEEDIKIIINFISNKYGRLDCLVNNAAYQICKPVWEMSSEEWSKVYDCNVKSIYLFVKYSLYLLKNTKGNIINIGSVHSVTTSDEIAAYASTKSAIAGLTKNLAIELSKFGIRINCISPGAVDTPMLRDGLSRGHIEGSSSDELVNNLGKKHLLGRVGKPEEIANIVEFVSNSNNGEFINGANILIDGGASIKLSTE